MSSAHPPYPSKKTQNAQVNQQLGGAFSPEKVSFLEIDENSVGQRLDNFLFRICKGVPKSHIYRIVRSGEVRVNKGRIGVDYKLEMGDMVRVPPLRLPTEAQKQAEHAVRPAEFPIVFEDDALLVINKPAGVAVHGGSGVSFGVIEQIRAARPQAKYLELVHRLDRETSGILLIAKKRSALTGMHQQMRRQTHEDDLDKRYLALVKGKWLNPKQAVKQPLFKYTTAEGERRVMVRADGLTSHTVFTLQQRYHHPEHGCFSLLEAELLTGRTHQIRVHLQHTGFPILGDDKYGDFTLNKQLVRVGLKRMFLHAYRMHIRHPLTGELLQLDAPLAPECQQFINTLLAE